MNTTTQTIPIGTYVNVNTPDGRFWYFGQINHYSRNGYYRVRDVRFDTYCDHAHDDLKVTESQ